MSEEKNCIRHEMTNLTLFRGHCPSYKTDKLWHRYVISVTASLETSGIRAVERVINKSSSPRKFFTPDLALIRRPRWTYAEINGRSRAIGRVFFFFSFFFLSFWYGESQELKGLRLVESDWPSLSTSVQRCRYSIGEVVDRGGFCRFACLYILCVGSFVSLLDGSWITRLSFRNWARSFYFCFVLFCFIDCLFFWLRLAKVWEVWGFCGHWSWMLLYFVSLMFLIELDVCVRVGSVGQQRWNFLVSWSCLLMVFVAWFMIWSFSRNILASWWSSVHAALRNTCLRYLKYWGFGWSC